MLIKLTGLCSYLSRDLESHHKEKKTRKKGGQVEVSGSRKSQVGNLYRCGKDDEKSQGKGQKVSVPTELEIWLKSVIEKTSL